MIADALFRLLKAKPFSQITVTDICNEAAIGRKTFYRNFDLREDVITYRLDQMVDEYEEEASGLSYEERLRHHFSYAQRYAEIFSLLYRNDLLQIAEQRFRVLLPKAMLVWSHDPIEQEYRSRYIMAGIDAIQTMWIERGFRESIDDVLEMVRQAQDKATPMP